MKSLRNHLTTIMLSEIEKNGPIVSKCAKQQSLPVTAGRTANWHKFFEGKLGKIINNRLKIDMLSDPQRFVFHFILFYILFYFRPVLLLRICPEQVVGKN